MSPSFFKKTGTAAVKFTTASRTEIDQYTQMLAGQGYIITGTPIEYRQPMSQQKLRDSAKAYAHQNGCILVVEVNDPNPVANPYNPYKYYLYQHQSGHQAPEPTEPPSRGGNAGVAQQSQQTYAQFTCPYCQRPFNSYVNPGDNVLTCPSCKGQSMVNVPAPAPTPQGAQSAGFNVQAELAKIKLRPSYNTLDEMVIDCLDVLGKMLMVDPNMILFEDTGEFLYPFIRMKKTAYQHIGFRNIDVIFMREATHDFKIIGSEEHSHSQANVNPHRDDLFSVKILGGVNFLVLEQFKALEPDQKQAIANAFYAFLTQYVGVMS